VDRIGRASDTRDADVFRWMNAALSEQVFWASVS